MTPGSPRGRIRQLRNAGMHAAFHQLRSPAEIQREIINIQKRMQRAGGNPHIMAKGRHVLHQLAEQLQNLANATENGVRAAVSAAMQDALITAGIEPKLALTMSAAAGKDLSVNFQRYGT